MCDGRRYWATQGDNISALGWAILSDSIVDALLWHV